MKENETATGIIGAAIQVHSAWGPGLMESTYKSACVLF
ncbi:MAG TPA: GxxExxY protein [Bacteroidia bacterium]|nr:GxxExxY protein [Bacteroidia bacterium]